MRKKKINFAKYADMCEKKELTGKDGTVITVRDHIPYADKMEMVKGIIEDCVMVHDDSCVYENAWIHAERIKAIMKYYTDVPVDDVGAGEVADFVINNDLIGQIREVIHDDWYEAEDIFVTMLESVEDTTTDDMSLKKAIKTSFGFLFNGEDITESMAKAEMTKDTMFKALNALNEKEKQEQEKLNSGTIKLGNNILNFAKKE